ncbi:hypothetical protein POM88_015086 [Heracleum sosnowskyi]|uniref:MULE transposase domain-containing protein n=1 Tax=Heracleum sosnowskyi TaxID=360622 RepID=A0AAD8ILL5_9APIA|nr:hypothetical protein POM88_015086 [Heracleum sosnowskyi]
MHLLNIVGVTSFNTTFFSAIVFLQKEEVGDYVWALEYFRKILGLQRQSLAIVTDRELALMNAIKAVFLDCSHLLCVWHIEKNIMAKCKKKFNTNEEWEEFIIDWTNVMKSPNQVSFFSSWGNFTSSMGLPCAHNIRERVQPIQHADVHPQWRLDIRSLMSTDSQKDQIEGFLKKVYDNYKKLPLTQKNVIEDKFSGLLIFLFHLLVNLGLALTKEDRWVH